LYEIEHMGVHIGHAEVGTVLDGPGDVAEYLAFSQQMDWEPVKVTDGR
jgi:hypothetical protein